MWAHVSRTSAHGIHHKATSQFCHFYMSAIIRSAQFLNKQNQSTGPLQLSSIGAADCEAVSIKHMVGPFYYQLPFSLQHISAGRYLQLSPSKISTQLCVGPILIPAHEKMKRATTNHLEHEFVAAAARFVDPHAFTGTFHERESIATRISLSTNCRLRASAVLVGPAFSPCHELSHALQHLSARIPIPHLKFVCQRSMGPTTITLRSPRPQCPLLLILRLQYISYGSHAPWSP